MSTYGLIILLLALKRGESIGCDKLMPGLARFQCGVDIAKVDLLRLGPDEADDGFGSPVVHYTCDKRKKINFPPPHGETSYDEPDQIDGVSANNAIDYSEKVDIVKSREDVRKLMKANMDGGDKLGLFSLSASYNKMMSSVTNKSVYLESTQHVQPVFRVRMVPPFSIVMSEHAEKYIANNLPKTFEEDPESYQTFIDHFGTHYYSRANFGGVVRVLLETNADYYEKKSDSEVKAEAKATFKNILEGNVGFSRGSNKVDEDFKKMTAKTIRVLGGDHNPYEEDEGFKGWAATIPEKPYLYKGTLKPIYDFIKDRSKRKSMKRAVQVHIGKAQLKAARKLLKAKLETMRGAEDDKEAKLQGYLDKCDELIRQNDPDEAEVRSLAEDIEQALSWVNVSGLCKTKFYREFPCQNGYRVGCYKAKGSCWRICEVKALGESLYHGWKYEKDENGNYMECSTDMECVQKGAGTRSSYSTCRMKMDGARL